MPWLGCVPLVLSQNPPGPAWAQWSFTFFALDILVQKWGRSPAVASWNMFRRCTRMIFKNYWGIFLYCFHQRRAFRSWSSCSSTDTSPIFAKMSDPWAHEREGPSPRRSNTRSWCRCVKIFWLGTGAVISGSTIGDSEYWTLRTRSTCSHYRRYLHYTAIPSGVMDSWRWAKNCTRGGLFFVRIPMKGGVTYTVLRTLTDFTLASTFV